MKDSKKKGGKKKKTEKVSLVLLQRIPEIKGTL